MSGEERGSGRGGSCDPVGGGYTIFLDEERIRSFFEEGDFSSAGELEHFREVGAQVEKRVKEGSGASFLALSIGEERVSRDFAVLEIAHILAKHGKTVLVVDCDFLHPGLSGVVENIEEHGFLDLLLYGSSLKTVARPVGIDGMSVTGSGSFPVSRTIPFALKEFSKIKEYLRSKHDVVIYCSTFETEDGKINPLASLVEGVILCCRLEEMPEGELQRRLGRMTSEKVPPIELVCFCGRKEQAAQEAPPARAGERKIETPAVAPAGAGPSRAPEASAVPLLEKSEDLEPLGEEPKGRVNIPRMVVIGAGILVAAFAIWWAVISRTAQDVRPQGDTPPAAEQPAVAGADTGGVLPAPAAGESLGVGTLAAADSAAERVAEPVAETATPSPGTVAAGAPAQTARYAIHTSSFKVMERAENEKAYLEKNGFAARIVEVDIGGEKWLRVFVGAYATMDEASKARLDLLGLSRVGYARIVAYENPAR